jgi:iron complex outermembrane receptor protein
MKIIRKSPINAALLASTTFMLAQFSPNASAALEEIIVTAQKRSENLQEVPISIQAFTSEQLYTHRIDGMIDLGNFTPGLVTTTAAGSATAARMWIRGIGTGAFGISDEPRVAVYVDGVYLGKAPGLAFDSVDLERVEVLKGPQGTLYGRNAVGGAINLISKRASTDALEGKLRVTGGNYDREEVKGDVNVPLTDTTAVKLAVMSKQVDGWVENKGPGEDFWGYDREAYRLDTLWQPTDALRFDYAYEYNDSKAQPQFAQSLAGTAQPEGTVLGSMFYQPTDTGRTSEITSYIKMLKSESEINSQNLLANWDLSEKHTVKAIVGYRSANATDARAFFPQTTLANLPDYIKPLATCCDRVIATYEPYQPLNDLKQWSIELDSLHEISDELDFTAGLFYYNDDATGGLQSTLERDITKALNVHAIDYYAEAKTQAWAAFGSANWTPDVLDRRLTFTFGLRYSLDDREGESTGLGNQGAPVAGSPGVLFTYDPLTGKPASFVQSKNNWDSLDPQFIARYDLNDTSNVYGSYTTAYRSGGYNTDTASLSGFVYKPEEIAAYEIGYKGMLLDSRLQLNAAVFYYDRSNIQSGVQDPEDPVVLKTVNTDGTSKGFELDITAQLMDHLTGTLSYAYLDAKEDPFTVVFREGTPDQDVVKNTGGKSMSPENTVFAALDYSRDLGFAVLDANVSYSYSEKYDSFPGWQLTDRNLIDARIGLSEIASGPVRLSVSLWGKNLTDDEYTIDRVNIGPALGSPDVAWYGTPRTYGVDFIVNF